MVVARKVFGVPILEIPTMAPSTILYSALPFSFFHPFRFLPLKSGSQFCADKEAAQILEQARQEADDVRQQAFDQGFEEGKAEGIRRGQSEIENEKNEILQEKDNFRKQYEDTMAQMEPKFADVLCTLLQKLTGVLVSDQREVLTYLIHRTMMDMEPSSKFVLRVSTEDFPYMEAHKEEILMKAGVDAAVEVQEEKSLKDGECIIETDSQMMDCSFHTQLKNMTDTLRLLAQSH